MVRGTDDAESERGAPFRVGKGRLVQKRLRDVLIELDESSLLGRRAVWIPRRVLHAESDVIRKPKGELVVQRWYAAKIGWLTE